MADCKEEFKIEDLPDILRDIRATHKLLSWLVSFSSSGLYEWGKDLPKSQKEEFLQTLGDLHMLHYELETQKSLSIIKKGGDKDE